MNQSINPTPNQQRALDIGRHICVTAGAGSGKTKVLVDRYLEILRQENITPEMVVAITFTDKAAAEMKGRIIEKLNEADNAEIRKRHIEQMNSAPISTIHSFCGNILREFPFQGGVPANFSIVQGLDQKLLINQAIQEYLRDLATDPNHIHHDALRYSLQRYGNRTKLLDLFSILIEKREIVDQLLDSVYAGSSEGEIPTEWKEAFFEELPSEAEIDEFLQSLFSVLQIATGKKTTEAKILTNKLGALSDRNPSSPNVQVILNDIIELIANKGGSINKPQFLGNKTDITTIESDIEKLESVITKIKSTPQLDSEDTETDDLFMLETTKHLLSLYNGIQNEYQNKKLAQGKLDFTDLQLMTRDLLKSNETIRNRLVERHRYFMIDEYQDTNEVQYELVMLLTNELQDANLFIVGDPKQSIFGFRGADVRIFNKTRMKIEENGGENIELKENFRSHLKPVGFVNYFFESLMGDGTQTEYDVPFEALTKARTDSGEGSVEILLGNSGERQVSEYRLIAHHINTMVADGINYEDIAILIRYRSHLPDLEEALISAGIPYLTTGGVGFYQRQEIYDIWNYLNFLNDPTKNHTSLVGILRGPAFGISDTELYEISIQSGKSFWEKVRSFQTPSVRLQEAIEIIRNQSQYAHRIPVNQLIQTVVNETGLIGTLNLGQQGQQRYANYQKLLDLARHYDGEEHSQTLADFITFLDILITDEPREGQAQIDNISGSVEIMTVHSAKGKQFPVVILPCLHRGGRSSSEPFIDEKIGIGFKPWKPDEDYIKSEPEIVEMMKTRATNKDTAEKKRLFYVAATRAKDRLVLSGAINHHDNIGDLLKWLYEHLEINKEDENARLEVAVDEYTNETRLQNRVQLNIPIIKTTDVTKISDRLSHEKNPDDFPEHPMQPLQQGLLKTSYSVIELANYARCPLRYQLEHRLRIPSFDNWQSDRNDEIIDYVVRNILLRINQRQDRHYLHSIIDRAFENYPDINNETLTAGQRERIMEHIMNYQNSEIAEMIHTSSKTKNSRSIHANINGQVVSCRIDRMFKDQSGSWNGIKFITSNQYETEYYEPEMELICLLLHKSYPEQDSISVMSFNTSLNQYHTACYNDIDFQEISDKWTTIINEMQQKRFDKNLSHCSFCQFSDIQDNCIVD